MKKGLLALSWIFLAILLLVGCENKPNPLVSYEFKDAFNDVLELDKKYNTSFYTEALDVENVFSDLRIYYFDWNRTIIREDFIDSYQRDLAVLEKKYAEANSSDVAAILIFFDARGQMIEAERLYLNGLAIKDRGNAFDGFSCKDMPHVVNLTYFYNQSSLVGQNAASFFDDLLTGYPQTRSFLSNEKRPKFYDSPFWPIRKFSINNLNTIEKVCKNASKN